MTEDQVVTQDGEVTGLSISKQEMVVPEAPTREEIAERQARLDELEAIDIENKPSAVTQYWEASKGDSIRGIFEGWKILEKKDDTAEEGIKKIPAVVILTKDGKCLAGSMQIVDSFLSIPISAAVYIECVHNKSGEMKKFDIRIID